jgi:hypothetical protein
MYIHICYERQRKVKEDNDMNKWKPLKKITERNTRPTAFDIVIQLKARLVLVKG